MNEAEKLRALLAEARMYLTMNGGSADDRIVRSIDAALAEPVSRCPWGCPDCGFAYGEMPYCQGDDHGQREADLLRRERDEARAMLSAICVEFECAVAHADWRAAGSPGMSVPFSGDFASATQLPSVVGRMRWWAREMRKVIKEKKE